MKSRGKATRGWYGARLAGIAAVVMSSLLVAAVAIAAPGGEKGKPESQPNSSPGTAGNPGGQQGQESRADPGPPAGSNTQSQSEAAPQSQAQSPSNANGPKSTNDSQTMSTGGNAESAPPAHADGGQSKSSGGSTKSSGGSTKSSGRSTKSTGGPPQSTGHSNEGGRERLERDSRTGSRNVRPEDRGPAEWTMYCHSTRSTTNPFVLITTNNNALWGHDLHHEGDDVIPATDGECPPGTTPTDNNPRTNDPNGPAPRTTDGGPGAPDGGPEDDGPGVNGVEDAEDVVGGQPAPGQGAPEDGVRGVSESSPGTDDGDRAGPGIAEEGGVDAQDDELPFTGLGLIAILAAALLALGGGIAARRASS